MADINLDDLGALGEELDRLKEIIASGSWMEDLKNKTAGFGQEISDLKQGMPDMVGKMKDLATATNAVASAKLGPSYDAATQSIKSLNSGTEEGTQKLVLLGAKLLELKVLIGNLPPPTSLTLIGSEAARTNTQLKDMAANGLKALDPLLSKFPKVKGLLEDAGEVAGASDFAKNFELDLLRTATASGQFSQVLQGVGRDFSGLPLKAEAFSRKIMEIGINAGMGTKEVAMYASMLRTIPGALDNFKNETGKTVEGMDFLDAAIKVSLGTGQEFSSVVNQMSEVFDHFGTRGRSALEEIAKMHSVADQLGLPMQKMNEYIKSISGSFEFLGDNVVGATRIMEQMGPALQASGLGPAAIRDLVTGITKGVAEMGTAQKAFLSARTGGPGGLQGAFQIDLMMRQGKVDEVFKKVEENLRKQFGKVVSLDEAAQSQGAAAQYQRQIAMLRSPAFGGLAKDDKAAERILDALAKGPGGMGKGGLSPADALKDSLQVGQKFEERQANLLTTANNKMDYQAGILSIIAYNTARAATGQASPFGTYLKEMQQQAGQAARNIQPITGKGTHGGKSVDDVLRESYESSKEFLGDIGETAQQISNAYNQERAGQKPDQGQMGTAPRTTALIPGRATPTTNQFAARTLQTTERTAATVPGSRSPLLTSGTPKVDVNVTTTCVSCQKKLAQEEAQKAVHSGLDHYQKTEQINNYNPAQTF